MASAEIPQPAEQDWGVSNPWPWLCLGLVFSTGVFAWTRLFEPVWPEARFGFVVAAVLLAVVALWLRFRQPAGIAAFNRLEPFGRTLTVLIGSASCAALTLGLTVALLVQLAQRGTLPWTVAELMVLWLLVVPWSAYLATHLWKALAKPHAADERFEGAALCLLAALVSFLCCWALYLGADRVEEWDSLRLFFAGLALAGLVASYVAGVGTVLRRVLLSALILFHLSGIALVCLAHPPGPWILQQVWIRLYRPYLEFMYLNNAYRFYAPEPGPGWQLWCYLEYDDPAVEPRWIRIPELDDGGQPQNPLALQYQRRIAMIENVSRPGQSVPPLHVVGPNGQQVMAPHYKKRDDHSPYPQNRDKLGYAQPANPLGIPYYPDPTIAQYQLPDDSSKALFASFARRLCSFSHPNHPELKASSVKLYRVLHRILRPDEFARGHDPHDRTLFLPFYMGKFAADGGLLDPNDPFLHWLVPILPDNDDPERMVRNYAIQHATGGGTVIMPRSTYAKK